MEWTRIDVQSDEGIIEGIEGLSDLKVGLDTDAESMHQEFLGALPHLSEVQEMHGEVVSEIESRALSDSVSTLGQFVRWGCGSLMLSPFIQNCYHSKYLN